MVCTLQLKVLNTENVGSKMFGLFWTHCCVMRSSDNIRIRIFLCSNQIRGGPVSDQNFTILWAYFICVTKYQCMAVQEIHEIYLSGEHLVHKIMKKCTSALLRLSMPSGVAKSCREVVCPKGYCVREVQTGWEKSMCESCLSVRRPSVCPMSRSLHILAFKKCGFHFFWYIF